MVRDKDDIEASLLRKGFQKIDGDHHFYIYWNLSGKKTMKKTKMSHGTSHKSIGDILLGKMAKQIGISKKSFIELIDCTLDRNNYELLAFSEKN